jgi:hypothetical protein
MNPSAAVSSWSRTLRGARDSPTSSRHPASRRCRRSGRRLGLG